MDGNGHGGSSRSPVSTDAMQTFMQANGVRAAQLAIAKNGVIEIFAGLHLG